MRINIEDFSGHVEMAKIDGYSPSRSLHTLKWLESKLEREYPSFFEERRKADAYELARQLKYPSIIQPHWRERTDCLYSEYFWSDLAHHAKCERIKVSGGSECRLRVAHRWITLFFVDCTVYY